MLQPKNIYIYIKNLSWAARYHHFYNESLQKLSLEHTSINTLEQNEDEILSFWAYNIRIKKERRRNARIQVRLFTLQIKRKEVTYSWRQSFQEIEKKVQWKWTHMPNKN